jgi:hypothetical protein
MKRVLVAGGLLLLPVLMAAQQGRGGGQFPGGTNPDGSLRPSAPVGRLFTQDAYTEYALLEPGSESFRIRFLPEETRAKATELVNATRGGSEGSGIEVYDPRTGQPLKFTYEQQGSDPENHAIRATLPMPVPEGGIGRVLIYKTYKDPRTYMMNGDDIVWVRSLSGYRLGVVLPKGFAFISSNVAAQLTTTADGRLKLAFANPSGQANPVTIHARRTTATFPPSRFDDMFFDDIRTLYDLDAPETGRIAVEQTYSDYRKGGPRAARFARLPAAAGSEGHRSRHGETVPPVKGRQGDAGQARRAHHGRQAERAHQDHRDAEGVRLHGRQRRARVPADAQGTAQHGPPSQGMGRLGRVGVRDHRHGAHQRTRVRLADQPERRQQLQGHDSGSQGYLARADSGPGHVVPGAVTFSRSRDAGIRTGAR